MRFTMQEIGRTLPRGKETTSRADIFLQTPLNMGLAGPLSVQENRVFSRNFN